MRFGGIVQFLNFKPSAKILKSSSLNKGAFQDVALLEELFSLMNNKMKIQGNLLKKLPICYFLFKPISFIQQDRIQ